MIQYIIIAFALSPQTTRGTEFNAVEIKTPAQIVMIDDQIALFEADFFVADDGQTDGYINLIFRNGITFKFNVVFAAPDESETEQSGKGLMILAENPNRTDDDDVNGLDFLAWQRGFEVGVLTPDSFHDEGIIWDLLGLQFETESQFLLTTHEFPQSDVNQADYSVWRDHLGQTSTDSWDDGYWPLKFGR